MLDDKENKKSELDNSGDNQPKKRKRVRMSDASERPAAPYRSSDNDRAPRSSAPKDNQEYNRGGYPSKGNDRGAYQPREGYGQRDRSYGDDQQRGGYQQRSSSSSGGYQQRGGYDQQRGGGYGGGGGYQQRDGDQRRPYQESSDNRGGYQQRGPQRPKFNRPEADVPKRLVKPVKYKETIDPSTEIRLNKYLANAGVCSRREADTHITAGAVKVNGTIVNELGAKVKYGDAVTFHDQPVQIESKVYVLLNKPKNCVTTSDDPQNRLTVMDLVKNACSERIYPVGRLDRNTTGVLLLTNDGDLASKLMHPKYKKKKIYQVTLDRDVSVDDMQAIADGIELDDGEIHADSIAYSSEDKLNEVGIEIHSGRNRIVRRIFEKLNYKVVKLDRVYFSGLTKKNVPRGKWRYLTPIEVNILRMGAFE